MRALVLGGTRFIGLHLVYELLRRGHQVALLNRGQAPAALPPDIERLYADRADPTAVKRVLRGREFDVAFDISAYTTSTLAPAVEALEGHVGRYIFCSTVGVYAPSETLPITEDQPLAKDTSQTSQYGLDKVACEEYLRERWRARAFPFTTLRPCTVYGPNNYNPQREFSLFARLLRKRPILVPGDGSAVIHLVHVSDLARAFAAAPETGSSRGQAYTLAGPEAVTLLDYVSLLGRIVGIEPSLVLVPPEMLDDRGAPSSFPAYPWRSSAIYDTKKAQAHLDFQPRPMAVGTAETYRWYIAEGLNDRPWDFSAEDGLLERLRV